MRPGSLQQTARHVALRPSTCVSGACFAVSCKTMQRCADHTMPSAGCCTQQNVITKLASAPCILCGPCVMLCSQAVTLVSAVQYHTCKSTVSMVPCNRLMCADVSAGSAAAALGPLPAEDEPDLSDLLWDSNDLLSLSDLLDDNDAAWPPAGGAPFLPLDELDQGRLEQAPLVCCHLP